MRHSFLLVVLIVSAATAQTPAPVQSPCSASDLRASMAIAGLAAERLRAETSSARADALEKDLAQQKGLVVKAEQRLGAEQQNAASLAASNQTAQQQIAAVKAEISEARKTIAAVTGERDAALSKIAKANRAWGCRTFRIGCVGVTK